jgi:hypothetical protein
MSIELLNIELNKKWFWITMANVTWKEQSRSLFHIEKYNGVWKFQLLWMPNNCWVVE